MYRFFWSDAGVRIEGDNPQLRTGQITGLRISNRIIFTTFVDAERPVLTPIAFAKVSKWTKMILKERLF